MIEGRFTDTTESPGRGAGPSQSIPKVERSSYKQKKRRKSRVLFIKNIFMRFAFKFIFHSVATSPIFVILFLFMLYLCICTT